MKKQPMVSRRVAIIMLRISYSQESSQAVRDTIADALRVLGDDEPLPGAAREEA